MKAVPTAMDIEVISIKPLLRYGNLKAFVSIRLDGIEINGIRIVQQPHQRPYVQLPVVEYTRSDDGQRAFAPLIRIHDPTLDAAIRQAVMEVWQKTAMASVRNGGLCSPDSGG